MGWLDVPHFVSELIITTYPTVDEQQEKAVEYWLRAVADASWPTLAGALYRFQEAEALQAIKDVAKSKDNDCVMHNNVDFYSLVLYF